MATETTNILALIGATTGVIGSALGVINTYTNLKKERVRLRVVPIVAHTSDYPNPLIGIRVHNDSAFPVTVDQIGFLLRGTTKRLHIIPLFYDGGDFPRRLESRARFEAFGNLDAADAHSISAAYAETADGVVQTGMSDALREIIASGKLPPLIPVRGGILTTHTKHQNYPAHR